MRIAMLGRRMAAVLVGLLLATSGSSPGVLAQGATSKAETGDPLAPKLELMLKSMRIARDWHVGKPTKPELITGAIEGLLARVDPEAELYTRAELRKLPKVSAAGSGDVGLEVRREPPARRQERRGYRVVAARDGSPAAFAGLKSGDLITHIDGRPAGELPYLVAVNGAFAGPAGSSVKLTVERTGSDAVDDVVLERMGAAAPSLAADEVAPGVTRVRIAAIDASAVAALGPALSAVAGGGARGLILDLRSTSTGSAEDMRTLADAFLEGGPVLRIAARAADAGVAAEATPGDVIQGRPLVVLVDGGTSGVAEGLAAALKESRRARLVGVKTSGRGAVRTLVPLGPRGEKGALRITTSRLLTPAGAPLEGKGVVPDVVFDQLPAAPACRTLDAAVRTGGPRACAPRTVAEDGQLGRAIGLLDEPVVAAKDASGVARP